MWRVGIDIGNTRTKYYLIRNGELQEKIYRFDQIPWEKIEKAAVVRTGKMPAELKKILENPSFEVIYVSPDIRLPFINAYQSPTLGADRIALVTGATDLYGPNTLVIDAGSCITYDFLDENNVYHGGAISPGIRMRYHALHDYTSDLPKLEIPDHFPPLTGRNTYEAIHSGVINGVLKELKGITAEYTQRYPGIRVILTGGDAAFLGGYGKIKIFAIQNYLLAHGLKKILQLN